MFPKQYLLFSNKTCRSQLHTGAAGVFVTEEIGQTGGRRNAQCKENWPANIILTIYYSVNNLMSYCLLSCQYCQYCSSIGAQSHFKIFIFPILLWSWELLLLLFMQGIEPIRLKGPPCTALSAGMLWHRRKPNPSFPSPGFGSQKSRKELCSFPGVLQIMNAWQAVNAINHLFP